MNNFETTIIATLEFYFDIAHGWDNEALTDLITNSKFIIERGCPLEVSMWILNNINEAMNETNLKHTI